MSRFVIKVKTAEKSQLFSTKPRSIKAVRETALWRACHDLSGVGVLKCRELDLEGDGLNELLDDGSEQIERLGGITKMRAVVLSESTPINTVIPENDGLFLVIEQVLNFSDQGWFSCPEPSIHAQVRLNSNFSDLGSLFDDLLLEISIANSKPFKSTIMNAIDNVGRKEFYRSKVEFLDRLGKMKTRFGDINPDCGYVCFSSVVLDKSDRKKYIDNVIYLWEKFLIEKYFQYFPSAKNVAASLKKWGNKGGQLPSVEKLAKQISILEPDIWVLLFVKRSSHAVARISTYIGGNSKSDSLNGHYKFIRASQLSEESQLSNGIKNLISENYVFPMKFLLGG
ncbi:hypothetical protein [Methylomonas sp. UP202]|uniref:hypothetical protein n=1 Tax=Methylomonas sp. UP202 TaxID=3040943 RepID=UPI0024795A74|nr:hypothetical protein [Methylomonas sp. UP202]WGS85939.1 hypothetical protein QC632_23345 [Methylomonas sp. UP202]